MIPQLGLVPGVGPVAAGPTTEASATAAGGSPLAMLFGDLLSAMTSGDAPAEGLPELVLPVVADEDAAPEAVSAGILALLASLAPDDVVRLQLQPGTADAVGELRQWLLQSGPPATASVTDAGLLAEDAVLPSAAAVSGLESRLVGSEASIVSAASVSGASAPATSATAPGLLDALQSLATAGQQAAGSDAPGSGNPLAAGLQSSAPERQLDITAGRLPQPAPLPPQELRATVSQTLEQVAWMSREGVHQARLQLEPAHLGRVDIWLDLEGGEARLHLGAQQVQVREALEAVLPRLREALAEHGMSLTDASVSQSGRDDASGDSGRGESPGTSTASADDAGANDTADAGLHSEPGSGLLDIYA